MASRHVNFAASVVGLALSLGVIAAGAEEVQAPAKVVKQAERRLKLLMKDGEDRPSVYEARLELVQALRDLQSCELNERIEQELATIAAWLERSVVHVRLRPQLVYNEIGRAAQVRAACAEDESEQRSHHEAALRAFARARQYAKDDYDALNEAVTLFNASASAEALDDLPQAIDFMEQACAIDREYALNENYMEDYRELVRLKDAATGTETAVEQVDEHVATLQEDTVNLFFKPTNGETERARSSARKVVVQAGERRERTMELEYSSQTAVAGELVTYSAHSGRMTIDGRDVNEVDVKSAALTPEEFVAGLIKQPFSYTVKTSGEFVSATGVAEMREQVLRQIDQALAAPEAAERRARVRQMAEQLLADEVVQQQIADEWGMSVAWWIDAALDVGDWYTLDVDAPQAFLPGETLKYTYTFKVNRRVACAARDASKRCVELIIQGRPDREQFADFLVAATARLVGELPRKEVRWFRARLAEDGDTVERRVLIADPATLKIYRDHRIKRSYVSASQRGGAPRIEEQTTVTELLAEGTPAKQPQRPAKPAGGKPKGRPKVS